MLHRLAVSLIAAASALSVSSVAHAYPLVCGDYLSGEYQPDELSSQASEDLAVNLRADVCHGVCAGACMTYDPVESIYACGIGSDPLFVVQGGVQADCNACIQANVSGEYLACLFDS